MNIFEILKNFPFLSLLFPALAIMGLMIIGFLIQHTLFSNEVWGIIPRTKVGLWGILFAPWWHGDIKHLIANLMAVFGLVTLLRIEEPRYYKVVFLLLYFTTNICVWLFARSANHIGISGVLYAIAGLLFAKGFITFELKSMVISSIAIIFYGGLVWGVLPVQPGVSWESHLFGLIIGVFWSIFLFKDQLREKIILETKKEALEYRKTFKDFVDSLDEKDVE